MAIRAQRSAGRNSIHSERQQRLPVRDGLEAAVVKEVPRVFHPGGRQRDPLSLPNRSSGLAGAAARTYEEKAGASLATIQSRDFDGPRSSRILARAFVRETLFHSHDVATLSAAMGAPASRHDLEELRPIEEVERLRDQMNQG